MKMRLANPSLAFDVRVRFYGRYVDVLGLESTVVSVQSPATVADVVAALRAQLPKGNQLPSAPLVAVDREHVLGSQTVTANQELAILPPLAGG